MKKSALSPTSLLLTLAAFMSCSDDPEQSVSDLKRQSSQTVNRESVAARVSGSIYDGLAGDPITRETAKKWTANYTSKNPGTIRGHYFGNEIIQQILNQTNCSGIRIYYALDDKGGKQLLLVGVDYAGNDLLPAEGNTLDGSGNIIADASFPCPDYCPDDEF